MFLPHNNIFILDSNKNASKGSKYTVLQISGSLNRNVDFWLQGLEEPPHKHVTHPPVARWDDVKVTFTPSFGLTRLVYII